MVKQSIEDHIKQEPPERSVLIDVLSTFVPIWGQYEILAGRNTRWKNDKTTGMMISTYFSLITLYTSATAYFGVEQYLSK